MVNSLATTWDVLAGGILRTFQSVLGQEAPRRQPAETMSSISGPSRLFTSRLTPELSSATAHRSGLRKTGLSKSEAEDLLDWLESHGQTGHVSFVPGEGFTLS